MFAPGHQSRIEREINASGTLCLLKWTGYLEKYWQRGFFWLGSEFESLSFEGILRKSVLKNENEYVLFFLDWSIAVSVPGYFKKYIPRSKDYLRFQYLENGVISDSAKLMFLGIDPHSIMLIDHPLSFYIDIPKFGRVNYESEGEITQEE